MCGYSSLYSLDYCEPSDHEERDEHQHWQQHEGPPVGILTPQNEGADGAVQESRCQGSQDRSKHP